MSATSAKIYTHTKLEDIYTHDEDNDVLLDFTNINQLIIGCLGFHLIWSQMST